MGSNTQPHDYRSRRMRQTANMPMVVIVRAVIVLAIQTTCRGGFCGAGLFGTDDENTRARKAGQQFFSQEFENKPVGRGISPPVGTISSGH